MGAVYQISDLTKEIKSIDDSHWWFLRNRDRLREIFGSGYVAIANRRVVDHDTDYHVLMARLWSRGIFPGPVYVGEL